MHTYLEGFFFFANRAAPLAVRRSLCFVCKTQNRVSTCSRQDSASSCEHRTSAPRHNALAATVSHCDMCYVLTFFFFVSHASHRGTGSRAFGLGVHMAFLFLPQVAHFGY